jgi:hypothetical protein
MPSAFSVANSPLTANGTIAVTGAGVASQYIRGDGTLADFPSSGGGGSSVSYYLNGGTSQGVIGGTTYYEMSKTADTGTGVDFPKTGDGLIVSFLTDANDPAQLNIPGGNWNYEIYVSMSSNGGTPQLYAELYKYDGTTFTLISTSANEIIYDGVNLNLYTFAMAVPTTTLTVTDRLAVKLYATNSGGKTTTVHTQNSHLCQVITTFSTGITALNGLTAQVQYFQVGTSGTDFNISSTTATHTFNLPTASATNRGALSSADWTTFNNKQPAIGYTPANDALVVHLAGTETITGGKTFSNFTQFNDTLYANAEIRLTGIGTASVTFLQNYNAVGVVPYGANYLGFNSSNNLYFAGDNKGYCVFAFNNSGTGRTYTLPGATGTLALTTDLSAYLPLAGGTMTGAIIGTTSTFTNAGSGIGVGITNSSTGDGLKITHSAGRAFQIASSATGYGILINNDTASTSVPFTIQKSGSPVITMTDAGGLTLAGALGGTSASFSSSVTATYFTASAGQGYNGNLNFNYNNANTSSFGYWGGGTSTVFLVTSAGAATFSSSVTAAGFVSTTNDAILSSFGSISRHSVVGLTLRAVTSSVFDLSLYNVAGDVLMSNPTGTKNINFNSGNVGIGTSSPNDYSIGSTAKVLQVTGSSYGIINANAGSVYAWLIADTGAAATGTQSNHDFKIVTNNIARIYITNSGAIAIANLAGTGSRAVLADASGNLSAPVSDISVKENIATIGYGLNEILQMKPVWFDYINEYKNYGEGRQNGNIAQDIEKIIPEAVFVTPTTGKMGINYDQFHAVYIKAIQELKAEIDELKNK